MDLLDFDPNKNYIGCSEWQYKLTWWIAKLFPDINWIAKKHDWHYFSLFTEKNHFIRLIIKIIYDLMFLIIGALRLLKNLRPDGLMILVLLYIALLVSTPFMLYIWRNKKITLKKPIGDDND